MCSDDLCFAIKPLSVAMALTVLPALTAYAQTSQEADFDASLLMPMAGGQTVDLSRYRFGNPIAAGDYPSDIFVNGERRGQLMLTFQDIPNNPISGLCLTPELVQLFDIKPEAIVQPITDDCANITTTIPQVTAKFDVASLRLDVNIPKILTVQRPKGYISPKQWQYGTKAAFVKYDINSHHYRYDGGRDNRHHFLGMQAGANLGAWSLRHFGTQTWQNHGNHSRYQPRETYAQRDIDTLKGRLILGDFYSRSQVMDNFGVRGVSLVSDTRMLPYSQSGYAPIVRGFANSNAKVTIRQNKQIIHETTVPVGAFVIDDLYPSSLTGELHVEITEDTGERREFIVPIAHSAQMLRPKHLRYEVLLGRYRESDSTYGDTLAQASIQYGLNNYVTTQAGVTITHNYQSALLGAIWGTKIGTIESNLTHTSLKHSDKTYHSNALRLGYNQNFNNSDTYIYANWYHYFSGHSFDLRDAVMDNRHKLNQQSYKNRYQLSFNQKLGEKAGSLYLSGSSTDYHHKDGYTHEYQIGYSNNYKRLQYRIGLSQSHNTDTKEKHKQIYANISIPFGWDSSSSNSHWLTASHTHQKEHDNSQLSLSGSVGKNNSLSYGVSASRHNDGKHSYSISGSYRAPMAAINANIGKSDRTSQLSYGISGAIVAHPHGITLGRELGDTFAIIHAKGAKGATIRNNTNLKLDRFGNGIVPNLTPYRINHIGISPDNIPDTVEISITGKDIIPRANTISLVDFETQLGEPILFEVKLADGTLPPIASEAQNSRGENVGYVVQGGRLFVRGDKKDTITVIWGSDNDSQCHFNYQLSKKNMIDAYTTAQPVICNKQPTN